MMAKPMKTVVRTAAAALLLAAGAAQAENVEFSLSEDSFRFGLTGPLSRVFSGVNGLYDVGYLSRQRDGDDTGVAHLGVMLTGDAGAQDFNLTAGAGVRGVFVTGDGDNGGAVAPGVMVEARMPGYERIAASAYGYYAPKVVSFGDIDSYRDVGGALSYEIIRSAAIYVGYRNVRIGVENGPAVTVDNGFLVGLALRF